MTTKVISLRLPADLAERLKSAYWASADQHRLSYNAWLVKVLDKAVRK
ncbi:MAG: hypothetical protein M3P06_11635 [Acidobacteriota bacterium]|nr:hypothetical protein [Acidobacteriota bacterium]